MIHINIDPILMHWGDLALSWHGVWLTVGILAAFIVVMREGRSKGIVGLDWSQLMLFAWIVGIIGARLLHVVEHWEIYAAAPASILAAHRGGMALMGGLMGGTLATLVFARWKQLPFWALMDAIAIGIPVGEIIGRMGCTINGDVHGVATNGRWGLVYLHPDASVPASLLGVPTFPAPTALQVWSLGLLIVLIALRGRLKRPGLLFLVCAVGYALGRFIISIWQQSEILFWGLKGTQVVSLVVLGVGIGSLLDWWRKPGRLYSPY